MLLKFVYPACFYSCEEGGFTVTIPDLQGAVTEGDTLEDAIEMAVDCASGWILGELDEGNTDFPRPSDIKSIKLDEDLGDGFISYIFIDLVEYRKKNLNKAVKKNLTIPQWLNDLAEEQHINFSSVLQNALKEQLNIK